MDNSSEMNQKDAEAERYIEVALRELNAGNYKNALKLLNYAKDLNPNARVTELQATLCELLMNVESVSEQQPEENASASVSAGPTTPKTLRRNNKSNQTTATGGSKDYSHEQLELVTKVNKCKNYYQVLGVTREAGVSAIKKSYKRLALQLHPDKNRAPGAVDAFKMVGKAVAVLTDSQKRKEYDEFGENPPTLSTVNGFYTNPNYQRFFHASTDTSFEAAFGNDDISAEELFNLFFGNVQPRHGRQRQYQNANQRQPQERTPPSLAFGLILVLIFVSMFSSFFTSDPLYSLTQTGKYPVKRETKHLSVPYYVKENFQSEGSLGRLENSVEEDFVYTMKQNCYRERSYREAMMTRARNFGSRAQIANAQALKMPSCESLSRIGIVRYSMF